MTNIQGLHLDRGYESLAEKLVSLGLPLKRSVAPNAKPLLKRQRAKKRLSVKMTRETPFFFG